MNSRSTILTSFFLISAVVLPAQAQSVELRVAGASTIYPLATDVATLSSAGPIIVKGGGSGGALPRPSHQLQRITLQLLILLYSLPGHKT